MNIRSYFLALAVPTIVAVNAYAWVDGYKGRPPNIAHGADKIGVMVDSSITPGAGTWTCPTDVHSVLVECWGAGGGGGGAIGSRSLTAAGGGSGGVWVGGNPEHGDIGGGLNGSAPTGAVSVGDGGNGGDGYSGVNGNGLSPTQIPGGGGGGARSAKDQTNTGGAGADGKIRFTY